MNDKENPEQKDIPEVNGESLENNLGAEENINPPENEFNSNEERKIDSEILDVEPIENSTQKIYEEDSKKKSNIWKFIIPIALIGVIGVAAYFILFSGPVGKTEKAILNTANMIQKKYEASAARATLAKSIQDSYKITMDFKNEEFSPVALFGFDFDKFVITNNIKDKVMVFNTYSDDSNFFSFYTSNDKGAVSVRDKNYSFDPAAFGAEFTAYFEKYKDEFAGLGFNENGIANDLSLKYDDIATYANPKDQADNFNEYKKVLSDLLKKATIEESKIKHTIGGGEVDADQIIYKFDAEDIKTALVQMNEVNRKDNVSVPELKVEDLENVSAVTVNVIIYNNKISQVSYTSDNNPAAINTFSIKEENDVFTGLVYTSSIDGMEVSIDYTESKTDGVYNSVLDLSAGGSSVGSLNISYDPAKTENNFSMTVPQIVFYGMPISVKLDGNLIMNDNLYEMHLGKLNIADQETNIDVTMRIEPANEAVTVPDSEAKFDTVGPNELLFEPLFAY